MHTMCMRVYEHALGPLGGVTVAMEAGMVVVYGKR